MKHINLDFYTFLQQGNIMHNGETVFVHQMLHLKYTAKVLMKFGVGNLQE